MMGIIEKNLETFCTQLQQVKAALMSDPENHRLRKLEADLTKTINFTKALIIKQNSSSEDSVDGSISSTSSPPAFASPSLINSSTFSKMNTSSAVQKKRAAPRRDQRECITLSSSDDEEPVPQKPKLTKQASVQLQVVMGQKNKMHLPNPQPSAQLKTKDDDSADPVSVFRSIEKGMTQRTATFKWVMVKARSVRVGSYKVTHSDTGLIMAVQLTELGITCRLPQANCRFKSVQVCIPMQSIINVKISNQSRLAALFISTGPKYAKWIRDTLGLDGSPDKEGSNYYCPLNGQSASQKTITIVSDESISPSDFGIIKALFKDVLQELAYQKANSLLIQMTPKSSVSYSTESSSSENSPGILYPRIVSTRSLQDDDLNAAYLSSSSSTEDEDEEDSMEGSMARSNSDDETGTIMVSSNRSLSSNSDPNDVILVYEGIKKVPIAPPDIRCLRYKEFLNDQIIDFWLSVIQTEILMEEDRDRIFIYDTFFYSRLAKKIQKKRTAEEATLSPSEIRHARVKSRTKNVDIFTKDFLIVPINEDLHWYLAVICFPGLEGYYDYETLTPLPNYKGVPKPRTAKTIISHAKKSSIVNNLLKNTSMNEAPKDSDKMKAASVKHAITQANKTPKQAEVGNSPKSDSIRVKHPCILILNSLAGKSHSRVFRLLREYLREEYKTKKKAKRVFDDKTIPGALPKVPQQPNFSDCGLFMMQYVESLFSTPPETFDVNAINLKDWFPSSIAENKRQEIYELIVAMTQEKFPQNVDRIPKLKFKAGPNNLTKDEKNSVDSFHSKWSCDLDDSDESLKGLR